MYMSSSENAVLHRKVAFIPQAFPVGFTPQFITDTDKKADIPELTDRKVYDTPIGPVCMSRTEHEEYMEEQELRKKIKE